MDNLVIYKKALLLVKSVYLLIANNNELRTDFSLCDQLKRASVSVVLNISEGYGRGTKNYTNYLRIASGSANEVIAVLDIVSMVYNIEVVDLKNEYKYLAKQIIAFSRSFIKN